MPLRHGPVAAGQLAQKFGVSRPTITRTVDGLVKKGLVERHVDATDRRVAMISLMGALLASTDSRFRSRVMGVRTLAVYGMPLGLMACGVLIERLGYSMTVSVSCVVGIVLTLVIGVTWRASIWRHASAFAPAASAPQRVS